ncbi:MAG: hypothetical protein R3A52_17220 [Polyangiales bacterium]
MSASRRHALALAAALLAGGCDGGFEQGPPRGRAVQLADGQQRPLGDLLGRGAALPGGCALDAVTVTPRAVDATYRCGAGVTALRLVADQDSDAGVRTRRFILEPAESMAPALVDALKQRVRAGEDALQWVFVPDAPPAAPLDGGAAVHPTSTSPVAGGALSERQGFARPAARTAHPWAEPLVPLLLALAFVIAVLRRQLKAEPRWMPWALAGVTALGAALRVAIAPLAPMNAFAFTRVLPLAGALYEGPAVSALSALTGRAVYLTDVIAGTNLALSLVTPLVFFAHARYLLRDARSALAAAAIVALLPMHLRFALSDVQFITSLVTSSFTFLVLYGALGDESPRWRALCFALLPTLSLATYLTRPENIIFAALDLGALTLYLRAGAPRGRLALAFGLIAAAAAWSTVTNLLTHFGSNVSSGLSVNTLRTALHVAVDPRLNTLINPAVTPPVVTAMAVVGAVTLWRAGERGRAVFLTTWLSAFFVVHSYVVPNAVARQARYHLHLVTPLALLAAASTPWWLSRPRALAAVPAVWMLLAPFIHLRFERDVDFIEMHEARLLRRERDRLAPCAVLEFNPHLDPRDGASRSGSRVQRMTSGARGASRDAASVLQLADLAEGTTDERFALSAETLRALPRCTYYYEGAACLGYGGPGALAQPCAEAHRRLRLTEVAREPFRWRWYDDTIAARMTVDPDGTTHMTALLPEGTAVTARIYRVDGPR